MGKTKGPFVSYGEISTFLCAANDLVLTSTATYEVKAPVQISRQRNWKPAAIKLPFLAFLTLLCLLCIIFLELLVRNSTPLNKAVFDVSKRNVGSAFADATASALLPALMLQATQATLATAAASRTPTATTAGTESAYSTSSPSTSHPDLIETVGSTYRASISHHTPLKFLVHVDTTIEIGIFKSTTETPRKHPQWPASIRRRATNDSSTPVSTTSVMIPKTASDYAQPISSGDDLLTTTGETVFSSLSLPLPTTSLDLPITTAYMQTMTSLSHLTTTPLFVSTGPESLDTSQYLTSTTLTSPSTQSPLTTAPLDSPHTDTPSAQVQSETSLTTTLQNPNAYITTAQPPEVITTKSNYFSDPSNNTPADQRTTTPRLYITTSLQNSNSQSTYTTPTTPKGTQNFLSLSDKGNSSPGPVSRTVTNSPVSDSLQTVTSIANSVGPSSTITFVTSNGQTFASTLIATPIAPHNPPQSTDASVLQETQHSRRPDLLLQGSWTDSRYFAGMYLPSILAVIIKEAWAMVAAGLKIMEPFYQLSRPDGASARESLMNDHLGGANSLNTFATALRGGVIPIIVIVVNLVVDLLAPISTESMTVIPLSRDYDQNGTLVPYNPGWVLDRIFVRVLQGMLSLLLIMTILIAIYDRRRRSGLSANPSKIATMAYLLNNPVMVRDFRHINANTSLKEIEASIAHNRYTITSYQDPQGSSAWGLVKMGEVTPQGIHRVPLDDVSNFVRSAGPMPVGESEQHRIKRFIWSRLVDWLLIFLIVGILATVIAYRLDHSDSSFNLFLNSTSFGPRFLLSLGASITTTTFQSLEREVRLTTPYRLLAKRNAAPHDTVLQSVNGTGVSGLVQSIRRGALFPAFLALVTLLGDMLIVVISCVPFRAGLTLKAYYINSYFCVAVATIMLGATISVFFWRQKNKKLKIPSEPNGSLIAMWISLSNSGNQLRAILNESGDMNGISLRNKVEGERGMYWAGWVRDEHDRNMWCIDRESVDRGFSFIQADFDEHRVPPSQDIDTDNPYTLTTYRNVLPTLPFIQTEHQEPFGERSHPTEDQDVLIEGGRQATQVSPRLQREYGDILTFQTGYEQRFSRSWSDYGESDISDSSNIGRAYSYIPTEYR